MLTKCLVLSTQCENIDKEQGEDTLKVLRLAGGDVYLRNFTDNKRPFDKAPLNYRKSDSFFLSVSVCLCVCVCAGAGAAF